MNKKFQFFCDFVKWISERDIIKCNVCDIMWVTKLKSQHQIQRDLFQFCNLQEFDNEFPIASQIYNSHYCDVKSVYMYICFKIYINTHPIIWTDRRQIIPSFWIKLVQKIMCISLEFIGVEIPVLKKTVLSMELIHMYTFNYKMKFWANWLINGGRKKPVKWKVLAWKSMEI